MHTRIEISYLVIDNYYSFLKIYECRILVSAVPLMTEEFYAIFAPIRLAH